MPRTVTVRYGDEDGYNRTDPKVLEEGHAQARLYAAGAVVGIGHTGDRAQSRRRRRRAVEVWPLQEP